MSCQSLGLTSDSVRGIFQGIIENTSDILALQSTVNGIESQLADTLVIDDYSTSLLTLVPGSTKSFILDNIPVDLETGMCTVLVEFRGMACTDTNLYFLSAAINDGPLGKSIAQQILYCSTDQIGDENLGVGSYSLQTTFTLFIPKSGCELEISFYPVTAIATPAAFTITSSSATTQYVYFSKTA